MSPRSRVPGEADAPQAPDPLAGIVIDSHTHLDVHDSGLHGQMLPDADAILAAAAEVGVTRVVQIGCDVESSRQSVAFARTRPTVVAGVALHPNEAPRILEREGRDGLEEAWAAIAALARDPEVRAVGETGLDYFRTGDEGRAVQHESFRWHIRLADELGKTLVIHDRDSHDDVLRLLDEEGAPERVVFHCFSGDAAMARHCAERGWFMSFAGVVTYKNNDGCREALRAIPDDLVLVETDAPYLTPVPHRGKPNASWLMPYTVRAIASERGVSEADMCAQLTANTLRAFGDW